ncbi:MAG: NUDIX domain-containing protein [Pirellulaceae bacterium]|jgi:8-oxo-dGTP pyrophosphatase MutT (NUDIX family)|nr:NUDIX domain-containing protein [Pirellulaceae bacterium]
MAREPIKTWCFAVVVVRKNDKYLVVQETKHDQLWYVPAGRVEPSESFEEAAVRETLEEAGIPVRLSGILRIEHSPKSKGARLRVVFVAEPLDDSLPKQTPDEESLQARWVAVEDLANLPLRGIEVRQLFEYVSEGGFIYPLSLLQREGNPF